MFAYSKVFSAARLAVPSGFWWMLAGGAGLWLRSLPEQVWNAVLGQTTLLVTVKDEDAAFQWVKEWFHEQSFLRRVRRVDLDTTLRGTELALMPAPGVHLFWRGGRPFWVRYERSSEARDKTRRRTESLTFHTVGRDQRVLREFVQEIVSSHRRREQMQSCLYAYDDFWSQVQAYASRRLASVILNPGEKERLVADVKRFRASRERYRTLGVPYHRGYLFFGPPGTGKTSLVSALAGAFGMPIYAMDLTGLNDRSLKAAMGEVPPNAVVLFEDIDCMSAGHGERGTEARSGEELSRAVAGQGVRVTLSGLLNVLDGFHAPESVIFVMTTNHPEALDPALLRPGRIDYKLYLGQAGEEQKIELYQRFFPEASRDEARCFCAGRGAATMADFQGLLLRLEAEPGVRVDVEEHVRTEERVCENAGVAV